MTDMDFKKASALCKALSDENRMKIVHILSCGELCACDILEYFDLSQPTLSHHLKILVDAGLVVARIEGKWTHYSLSSEAFDRFERFIHDASHANEQCLCKKKKRRVIHGKEESHVHLHS